MNNPEGINSWIKALSLFGYHCSFNKQRTPAEFTQLQYNAIDLLHAKTDNK